MPDHSRRSSDHVPVHYVMMAVQITADWVEVHYVMVVVVPATSDGGSDVPAPSPSSRPPPLHPSMSTSHPPLSPDASKPPALPPLPSMLSSSPPPIAGPGLGTIKYFPPCHRHAS